MMVIFDRNLTQDEITNIIQINQDDLLFDDCSILEDIKIEDTTSKRKYSFRNCEIKGILKFINCEYLGSINFENSYLLKLIFFDSKLPLCQLTISKKTIIEGIHIQNVSLQGIRFHNSSVEQSFFMRSISLKGLLDIQESDIKAHIRIETLECISFEIANCNIHDALRVSNTKSIRLSFYQNTFWESVNLKAFTVSDIFSIIESVFYKNFSVNFIDQDQVGRIKDIYLDKSDFKSYLLLKSDLSNSNKIEKVELHCSEFLTGSVVIDGHKIEKLSVEGVNYSAKISIRNCDIKNFEIDNFENLSSFKLENIKAKQRNDSTLAVTSSSLGSALFLNCNFDSFNKVCISNSILRYVEYTNITWFKPANLNFKVDSDRDEQYWRNNREVYRQLKICADNNQDRPMSLNFKAYEMDAYSAELSHSDNYKDRLMLYLNRISNYFGLSWTRGFFFTVFSWMLFYTLFVIIQEGLVMPWDDGAYLLFLDNQFWKGALEYLWLPDGLSNLVDTRSFKEQCFSLTILSSVFYICGKIVIAYGIFQTISAFRKYVK